MHLSLLLNNANSFVARVAGGKSKILYPIGDDRLARDLAGACYNSRIVRRRDGTQFLMYARCDDIHKLERMLREAQAQGKKRSVFLENEFMEIAESVHVQLLGTCSLDDIISSDIPGDMMVAQQMLRYCQAEELKDSQDQVDCCLVFEDSLGRFNIGVLRCRWGMLPPKVRSRVRSMYRWGSAFLVRQLRLQDLRSTFTSLLKEIEDTVSSVLEEFATDDEPASADEFLGNCQDLRQWQTIRPYSDFVAVAVPAYQEIIELLKVPGGDRWGGVVAVKLLKLQQLLALKSIQMKLIGIDIFLSDKSLMPMKKNGNIQLYGYYDAQERKISVRDKYSVAHKLQRSITSVLNDLDALDRDERMEDEKIRGQLWDVYFSKVKIWENKRGIFFRKNIFTDPDQHDELRTLIEGMIEKITELGFTPKT